MTRIAAAEPAPDRIVELVVEIEDDCLLGAPDRAKIERALNLCRYHGRTMGVSRALGDCFRRILAAR